MFRVGREPSINFDEESIQWIIYFLNQIDNTIWTGRLKLIKRINDKNLEWGTGTFSHFIKKMKQIEYLLSFLHGFSFPPRLSISSEHGSTDVTIRLARKRLITLYNCL